MTRTDLIHSLQQYQTSYPEEVIFIERFLFLLQHPDSFQRTHLPGHITGSAWIIDQTRSKVLLVNHAKLNRWLQPGGHADGDENVYHVALREANEETGLQNLRPVFDQFFDIDIHTIPTRKDMPEHDHYDIRFCFEADIQEPLIISHESTDLRWIEFADLQRMSPGSSMQRMKEKSMRKPRI